jgi:hypothetical protein
MEGTIDVEGAVGRQLENAGFPTRMSWVMGAWINRTARCTVTAPAL